RISARQRDGSVIAAAAAAEAAATRARGEFPGCEVVVASGPRLLQETADNLLPSVWWGLAWDFPAIFLLILVFLRSLRLACIAVPMAALPLIAAYGALPLIGWPLDIGVAMIACIALGVIVDDVIYMLHAIRAHGSVAAGAAEAGPVISAAATVLAASFLCCLVGGFAHTRHFGVMLAAAFAVGLAIVTMLIPALAGRRS
ncbi:MAG: MMPL family transporter, partial [Planctomycetes bacterium]|nr:MMPL family transporter [Planctomycetota bacterium]